MSVVQTHLRTVRYFAGLSEDELNAITNQSRLRAYSAGEVIFHEGDPADGLWIVESGHVKIYKLSPNGNEHILHLRGPGKSFNDIAALDGGPNPAGAAALSPNVQVWLVPAAIIRQTLESNSQVALNVIRMLSVRVRTLVDQIEQLALHSVMVRLARFLLRQTEDPSIAGPGVTRTAIAAHLNTTPQTVSVALRELEASGAIAFDRRQITIVREDLLRTIALL